MIMGSVAVIEQNGSISNLGLGLPAGIFTILATGKKDYNLRGFLEVCFVKLEVPETLDFFSPY